MTGELSFWAFLTGLPLIAAGFFLPGHCILLPWVRRPGVLASFLASSALLMNLALLFDASGVLISFRNLALALLLVSLLGWLLRRRSTEVSTQGNPIAWRTVLPWLPAAACGVVAVLYCCLVSPLSGYDNQFRWDFLARKMLELGHLHFYPPMSAEDYWVYGWPDGISPLVSTLNAWCYACFGAFVPALTFPRLLVETGLLCWVAARWGARLGGNAASGAAAVAALSCCPLLLWSLAIGQETGLTALTLASLLYFLGEEENGGTVAALQAGLAAGLGALSREYGLAWIILGVLLLGMRRRPRGEIVSFLAAALLVCSPWYLRNWVLTGNPLWTHSLAGLFPVNAVYAAFMQDVARMYSIFGHWDSFAHALWLLVPVCGASLLFFLLGLWQLQGKAWPALLGFLLSAILWLWSMHQTAAGWNISKRVLSPALLIAAVVGGVALARMRGWWGRVLPILLLLLALDSGFRSLHLPNDPWVSPFRYGDGSWKQEALDRKVQASDPVWDRIAAACANRGVLTDHAYVHGYFALRGVKVRPLVSPEVNFIWSDATPLETTLVRLRALGIRFVILSTPNVFQECAATRSRFLREFLAQRQPNAEFWFVRIYDLDKPRPAAPGPG
jgi:hypothetical protein